MTVRRIILTGLCCAAFACAKSPAAQMGNLNDPCIRNADCNAPFICVAPRDNPTGASVCSLDERAACDLGKTRCNGNDVETCTGDAGDHTHGNKWEVKAASDHCSTRCDWDAKTETATCLAQQCTPNTSRCAPIDPAHADQGNTGIVQTCRADGTGWADAFACPTTCQTGPDGSSAECSSQICEPFTFRCKADAAGSREMCNARGTAWVPPAADPQAESRDCDPANADPTLRTTCVSGSCLPVVCSTTRGTDGNVTAREQRCDGVIAEQCNDTQTAFVAFQVCANGCVFDATKKTASCPAAACTPGSTQCKSTNPDVLQVCNDNGTAWVDQPVPPGQRCVRGVYENKACTVTKNAAGTITSRTQRCNGFILEQCNDDQTGWTTNQVCQFGCASGTTGPACLAAACSPGDVVCATPNASGGLDAGATGTAVATCDADRLSYDFVQYCPAGCTGDTSKSPSTAGCNATFCPPLDRQCGTDPTTGVQYVKVCGGDGSAYKRILDCAQDCSGGVCTETDAKCTPGASRCVGSEVEVCVMLSSGVTEWRFQDHCLAQCSAGACTTGGAVGCVNGANATAICGAPNRQAITMHGLLPASEIVPCDAVSRVMVYTDTIVGSDGTPVPDGTLVTFAHDYPAGAPDSLLASADADPSTPGLQRPTLHGQAAVVVSAPASCASPRVLKITASAGGRATGSTTLNFAAPVTTNPPSRKVYVAEDFSTLRNLDRTNSTAEWNTRIGAAVALPAYSLGTGADGDLDVESARDLSADGYARAWNVTRMGTSDVSMDNVLPTVAPGDEVLLINLWSNSGTIGLFEFKRVAAVATGRVIFTEPIRNVYGNNGNNLDLSGQRTIIQRVPNFGNVLVGPAGKLTTTAPGAVAPIPDGGTGIVAFRVKGVLTMNGQIDASNKGLTSAFAVTPVASNAARLTLGSSSSGAGGGLVVIHAGKLTFKDSASSSGAYVDGTHLVRADSASGNGGSMWIAGGSLDLGTAATRFVGGVNGRIRLDYGAIDNNPLATPAPTVAPATPAANVLVGEAGAYLAASNLVYDESATGSGMNIYSADLLGVMGGVGATQVVSPIPQGPAGLQGALLAVGIFASADDGFRIDSTTKLPTSDYGSANLGHVTFTVPSGANPPTPYVGAKFRWRATLSTSDDRPVYLRGVAFRLNVQQ